MDTDDITLAIAVWGALLSTALGVFSLYRHWIERDRLLIGGVVGHIAATDVGVIKKWAFVLHITNAGARSLMLKSVCGKHKTIGDFVFLFPELPHHLEPGHYISLQASDDYLDYLDDRLQDLYAVDSLGRNFKMSRKARQALAADADKARAKKGRPGKLKPEDRTKE